MAAMAGSSIAGRDAAPWVTDFLNAAYYRREAADVDDLRLAFCILTTSWWRKGGRLHLTDLPAYHHAFGAERLAARGRLDRAHLLAGGARLFGDWFPDAYADDARRAWGIAFETTADLAAYDPERRLALARLGELTPERSDDATWHTYPPVAVPPTALQRLARPETWPDYATPDGRFTPLRPGGLPGQTFEIEVAAPGPVFTRGYVTATTVVTEGPELRDWFAALPTPIGGAPRAGIDLTTHEGHFMGAGHNRIVLFEDSGRLWAQAVGTWDPMPWRLQQAYDRVGRNAQAAFWGEHGMFGQL